MGTLEKNKMRKRGWRTTGSDNCSRDWGKQAEVSLVASIPKKYIAVPLTPYASLAHVPGEGLHFAKEVMQTCLHLVTMDMALCETKPTICIANDEEQWRTPNLIFWPQSVPGSSLWLIKSETTINFGSALGTKRTRLRDVVFQMKKEETESCTSAGEIAFLVWNS